MSSRGAPAVLLASLLITLVIPACQGNARLIPYTGTHGFQVVLENNPQAADPSWDQLKAFLIEDKTDERDYVLGDFVCGSFAQDVHNNAEKAGIRAAWVAIDLANKPIGHAINAFNTTDLGMAFTDSTGDTAEDNEAAILRPELEENGDALTGHSRDRIAYVVKGKELGFISLDTAQFPDYLYYEQYRESGREYMALLNEYNSKVAAYNGSQGRLSVNFLVRLAW